MGRDLTGADLGLLPEGSQSVVVICRSTYEPGGGGGGGVQWRNEAKCRWGKSKKCRPSQKKYSNGIGIVGDIVIITPAPH